MHFVVQDVKAFKRSFGMVEKFTGRNTTEFVLFEGGEDGGITLSATDLTSSIRMKAEGVVCNAHGVGLVAPKTAGAMFRKLPNQFGVELSDGKTIITHGQSRYRFAARDPEDFPDMLERHGGEQFAALPSRDLAAILSFGGSCASLRDEYPQYITGVLLRYGGGGLSVVSTDTRRLATAKTHCHIGKCDSMDLVLPWRAVREAARVIEALSEQTVGLSVAKNAVCFATPDVSIAIQRLGVEFPDFQKSIPKSADSKMNCSVPQVSLAGALERLGIVASDERGLVRITPEDGGLLLSSSVEGRGDVREFVPCEWSGEAFPTGWNIRFLREGVAALGGDVLDLSFFGDTLPVLMREESGDCGKLYLVMPVALEDETTEGDVADEGI